MISYYQDVAKRRENYYRNREAIRRKSKEYRQLNRFRMAKRKRRYQRQIKAGVIVPRKRVRTGLGYTFVGYHDPIQR